MTSDSHFNEVFVCSHQAVPVIFKKYNLIKLQDSCPIFIKFFSN